MTQILRLPSNGNSVEKSVTYEPNRGCLAVWIRLADEPLPFVTELPLGEIAHTFGIDGEQLDHARALFELKNEQPQTRSEERLSPHRRTHGRGSGKTLPPSTPCECAHPLCAHPFRGRCDACDCSKYQHKREKVKP